MEDEVSLRAIERALELGVNFIDTAGVYGDGRTEELVAKAIRGCRDQLVLATEGWRK